MKRTVIVLGLLSLIGYGAFAFFVWYVDLVAGKRPLIDVLYVTRAQMAYAAFNGGHFEGNLKCLELPGSCIPSHQRIHPNDAFMNCSPGPCLSDEGGKNRWLLRGPSVDPESIAEKELSPSSIRGFVYFSNAMAGRPWWASLAPLSPPVGYCGDSSGRICKLRTLPPVEYGGGSCPPDCQVLE